ncbi:hypothetical protein EHM92_02410, partial [bacterium]
MERRATKSWLIVLGVILSGTAMSQPSVDRIPVPLTDPGRPVILHVGLISGGITVKGYAGKEVIVEASVLPAEDEEEPNAKKAGSLKRIPNTST